MAYVTSKDKRFRNMRRTMQCLLIPKKNHLPYRSPSASTAATCEINNDTFTAWYHGIHIKHHAFIKLLRQHVASTFMLSLMN